MNRVRGGLRNASHTPKSPTPARPAEVVAPPEPSESPEAPEPRRGGSVAAPAPDALAAPPFAPEPDLVPPMDHRAPPVPVAVPIPVVPVVPVASPGPLPVTPVVVPETAPVTTAPTPVALPPGDDLMPARVTASRRARRRAQHRNRWMIGGAASLAGVLAIAGIAWAVAGDDGSAPAAKAPARVAPAPDRSRTSTTTVAADASSTTTTTTAPGAAGATAGAAAGAAAAGPGAPVAPDDGSAVDVVADISLTGCRYDADASELVGTGTVHNPGEDALIEIDVTFSDATGELDSASDIQQVAPGETLDWEASTLSFDPPTGTLTCQVSQS